MEILNAGSSNVCPDEKGTESIVDLGFHELAIVATYAPMKRGLKAMDNVPDAVLVGG